MENADEFPERMNLQICRQIDKGNLEIEIWERGSGYTKASGTGSCAAAAAAYKLGLVESRINVNQPGGMIQIDMEEDGTIYMTGTVGYIADMSVAESFFSYKFTPDLKICANSLFVFCLKICYYFKRIIYVWTAIIYSNSVRRYLHSGSY